MISVIISSVKPEYLKKVSINIENTIGVPYELITFANGAGEKGICEIYNLGIDKAKYDVLCFMHEDVELKTNGWGITVLNIFKENPNLGLLGVVGSAYKTITPSGWNGQNTYSENWNIIQSFKYSNKKSIHYQQNHSNKKLPEVACIDGVWFCTPKKVAAETMFDQDRFKGFHVYDIDFSLAVWRKKTVAVTFDILLEHFSEGRYDKNWMDDNLKLHEKWNAYLPLNIQQLNKEQIITGEKATFKHFIKQLVELNFPASVAFKMLRLNKKFIRLDPRLYFKLQYYILMNYLKKAIQISR